MNENDEKRSLKDIFSGLMLQTVPSYANKIYYSLGFLAMTSFVLLILSGIVLVFFGPTWWLTNSIGVFFRSIHLWSVQSFIFFILLHLLVVFSTAAYRPPRQLTWVIGVLMLVLAVTTAEFGYLLRGDLSSQIKAMHGAEFYGQLGVWFINNLNYFQIFGLHVVLVPLAILGLLALHYLFIKIRGIAKPFDQKIQASMTAANHTKLFIRGFVLSLIVIILAVLFPSPYLKPLTIESVAKDSPELVAMTALEELDHTSETSEEVAEKLKFDTAEVFVFNPLENYGVEAQEAVGSFRGENAERQKTDIEEAVSYFEDGGSTDTESSNAAIVMASDIVYMSQDGLYEPALRAQLQNGLDTTYVLRFLVDSGVIDEAADSAGIGEEQHGLLKEENVRFLPPGSWWLAPMDLLQSNLLKGNETVHRVEGEIFAVVLLFGLAFPFIPWVNRLPEKLPFARWLWGLPKEVSDPEKEDPQLVSGG